MSLRSIAVLGVIVVVCMALIVASALVRDQLTAVFSPFRFREFSRLFGFFTPRLFGEPDFLRRPSPVIAIWQGIGSALASCIFLFLVGLLALFAFPHQMRVVRDAFGHGVGGLLQTLGIGAFSAFVFLLLTILGFLTFSVAFPLPLVLLFALLLAAWGGLIGLALAFGRSINRWAGLKQPSPVLDLAFGTLILFTLTRIPVAGWVILAMLGMLALGAVIATRFGAGGAWSLAEFKPVEELQS
jgi:hypothetical protein